MLAFLAAFTAPPVCRLDAQTTGDPTEAFGGVELRTLRFTALPAVRRLTQIAIPIGVIANLGRLRLDLGSAYASTRLERTDSTSHQVDDLTDTQVRGSYTIGRDMVVATLAVNLPTGPREASAQDYSVLGTVSPGLLGFPIAAYANGLSVTGGAAVAREVGTRWSVGLAGSLRVSRRFTPYVDSTGPISYQPGLETRIRGAADGLLGSSRLAVALTFSTFGTDQFGGSGTTRGEYRPGPRWLAEAALSTPLGSSLLNFSVWTFHRAAGDTTGFSVGNREDLSAAELSLAVPLGGAWTAEPNLSGRVSRVDEGRGRMVGLGINLRLRLTDRISVLPAARWDVGSLQAESGGRKRFSGWYLAGMARAGF